jgi:hypothetical protein
MTKQPGLALAAALAIAGMGSAADKASDKSEDPVIQLDGCLQSTADEDIYVLKTGTKDVEVRGATTLKEHVGEQVAASGVWMEGRTDVSGKQNASTADRGRHLAVAVVRKLADKCEAP